MKIIAVGAHLDDIEISCGGLLADAVMAGHVVKMIVMSQSEYAHYDGRVWRTREQALEEGIEAARLLGVEDLEVLEFPTKDVPYDSSSVEALDSRITPFNPDVISTHWVYDTHQAHRNTALATISAARHFNNILMYEPMWPSGRSYQGFRGQCYYGVSEEGVKRKAAALMAHKSQYEKYGKMWLDAVTARGIYRGYEIGIAYAECFEVVRWQMKL